MSDVTRALAQLEEIHTHLARTEVYRGWRSLPVALSGIVGLAAAGGHVFALRHRAGIDPQAWVLYWLAVGVVSLVIGCAELLWRYLHQESQTEQRRTQQVVAQFLPALVAGFCLTLTLMSLRATLATLLPGLWALLFAVGIFSARPYLPTLSTLVSGFYALAGMALMYALGADALPPDGLPLWFSWAVGGVFGAGQFMAAAVLYWSFERPTPDNRR